MPQIVTSGTCTPVLYKVVYRSSESKVNEEDIINFTFEQCFNYFNWSGAVKVPGFLQYANKLSKMASENKMANGPEDKEMQNKMYFL